jgi:hypothetical protein
VNVIPSTVETTADLVVRVRWLRFARRLRDFESLARVPIPSALRILEGVYEGAHNTTSVFLDLPLLELSAAVPHLQGAPAAVQGADRSVNYENSLLKIKADATTYAKTQQLQRFEGGTRARAEQQQQQLQRFGDDESSTFDYE